MQEKKRIEVTIHSTGDAVIATDMEGRVTLLNRVAEELTGWTKQQALGKPIHEVFNIIDERTRNQIANPVDEAIKTGRVINLSNHAILVSRDGTERIIADSGAPIKDDEGNFFGAVLIFRDITHLQKLEDEALKIAKLESVGTLAGGIAHDFNNILTGILGNINLARMETNTTDKIRELLQEAEAASLRAATLTKQLLTFAKGGAPIRKPVALAQVIRDTATLAARGSEVSCRCSIAPDLWPVDADEGQISQVITNIVLNAKQAMLDGGAIEVDAINIKLNQEQSLGKKLPLTEGDYIRIAITDHGTGIYTEHLDKLFDPYFTTKQKGSGLGLSTSFSIIKKHDGHISVESEVSKGSTFYIYLPASREQVPASAIKEKKVAAGKGRILVMDDEEVIRDVAGRMLKQMGYQGIELASDGAEAIRKYQQGMDSGDPFAAVILDLTIPGGMGGIKAIEKLLEIDPQVKAVICSGYTDSTAMAEYRHYGFKGVIPKPFTTADLSKTLSDVINR
jgi:two-component system cell cycle sensor histidine kinase/response regulator CckA